MDEDDDHDREHDDDDHDYAVDGHWLKCQLGLV